VSPPPRSIDWRTPAIWTVLLTVSVFAHAHVEMANESARGVRMSYGSTLAIQISSHLVVAALLPAIYWLHRRWPHRRASAQPDHPRRGGRALQHRPYGRHGGAPVRLVRRDPG
jgi:hypothetical protein